MRVTFPCGDLHLEGDLTRPAESARGAVVCHPHPQYGGDMDNNVVLAITGALQASGCATLRFNFRGVGASTGSYGGGVGELDDVRAAARYVLQQTGMSRLTLAGYSFGALVALRAGAELADADRLIAIAPPLEFADLGFLAGCAKDALVIVGDRDSFCRVAKVEEELARVGATWAVRVLNGADHFFVGHEPALAEAVRTWSGR